jgi:hypothetical protein
MRAKILLTEKASGETISFDRRSTAQYHPAEASAGHAEARRPYESTIEELQTLVRRTRGYVRRRRAGQ